MTARLYGSRPPVAMVMTLLNEESRLALFLQSISSQTVRPDHLVIVDGGSQDATVAMVKSWIDNETIPTELIVQPGANISTGRNLAIAAATEPLIAVTDAGTVLDPRWLEGLLRRLQPDIDVVGGFFEAVGDGTFQTALAAIITPTVREIDPSKFLPSSRSLLMRRQAWVEVGGYPEWLDYCEDLVFDLRLKDAGFRFAFAPDAIARWDVRPTPRAFAKQYYRYARGDGKAGLWPKRHAVRYLAYATGTAIAIRSRSSIASGFALPLGCTVYMSRYIRRLADRSSDFPSRLEFTKAFLLLPIIVGIGDVAKMAGYPVGVLHRHRKIRGGCD